MSDSRFAGQTALVTGGSRGLGFLIAERLGRRGCRVVLCARDSSELDEACRRLSDHGIDADTIVADITDDQAAGVLVDTVNERFGQLDVLVNNAGVIQVGPLQALGEQDFQQAWDVMFAAPVRLTLAALPAMRRRQDGTIINIASVGGRIPVPHMLPYVAAKFAMTGWSSGLRAELAADGISVTTVMPGLMRTGSHTAARFSGDAPKEYAWFAALASLPLISGNAERAARAIVRAAEHRRAELVFTPAAKVGTRLYGLAPATVARLIAQAAKLLPAMDDDPQHNVSGAQAARDQSPLLSRLTALGNRAGHHTNEPAAD
jgi:short-subunit dehydrogenase